MRLEKSSDFRSSQTGLAKVVCGILETIHKDAAYFEQFSNLVAADLTACGDRAAMSLNIICANWMLYNVKSDTLQKQIEVMVSYGRTLKFMTYMSTFVGDNSEGVEKMLYATIHLKDRLNLLCPISSMLYTPIGALDAQQLSTLETSIKKLSDAECIYELEDWRTFLREHHKAAMEEIDDKACNALEVIEAIANRVDLFKEMVNSKDSEALKAILKTLPDLEELDASTTAMKEFLDKAPKEDLISDLKEGSTLFYQNAIKEIEAQKEAQILELSEEVLK